MLGATLVAGWEPGRLSPGAVLPPLWHWAAFPPAALQARVADGSLRFEGGEVSTIDGVRVDWPDGFGLIRGSNTTPLLVPRFQGHTKKALARIEREFMAALKAVKPHAVVGAGGD